MISLYTTERIISAIYHDDENQFTAWYDFIRIHRPSLRVLLDRGSDYHTNDLNPVYLLQKDYDIEVVPETDEGGIPLIERVKNLELRYIDDPHALFILDIDEEWASVISRKYGILCHPLGMEAERNPLFQEGVEKSIDKNEPRRGWSELLLEGNTPPSNYLIFIDRYIFADDRNDITSEDGFDNVFEILDQALPGQLGCEFHILFIFDASTLRKSKAGLTFESLTKRLVKIRRQLRRPYPIVMEALSISRDDFNYDETHNRRILSNFYLIRADHSLKAFRNGRGLYTQTLWLDWGASKGIVTHRNSDLPAKALYKYIRETKRAIATLRQKTGSTLYSRNGDINITVNKITHRVLKRFGDKG